MILRPIRPRYCLESGLAPAEVIETVRSALARPDPDRAVVGQFAGNHFELMIDEGRRHYWSPRLSLEVEARDAGSAVHALLGPHPSVWTMFAFAYITMIFASASFAMLGLSQWLAGEFAWGLWGLPGVVLVVAAMYAVSQVGQRLAQDQADLLQEFLRATVSAAPPSGEPPSGEPASGEPPSE